VEYSLEKIQEIAHGDEAFIQDMLVTFVENVTDDIETIQSLMPMEEWKEIAGIAHKLASRYAYMSADRLQYLACDIENSVLVHANLAGIAEKVNNLCDETVLLINLMKNDFRVKIE